MYNTSLLRKPPDEYLQALIGKEERKRGRQSESLYLGDLSRPVK